MPDGAKRVYYGIKIIVHIFIRAGERLGVIYTILDSIDYDIMRGS